jgi:hypothetical protein
MASPRLREPLMALTLRSKRATLAGDMGTPTRKSWAHVSDNHTITQCVGRPRSQRPVRFLGRPRVGAASAEAQSCFAGSQLLGSGPAEERTRLTARPFRDPGLVAARRRSRFDRGAYPMMAERRSALRARWMKDRKWIWLDDGPHLSGEAQISSSVHNAKLTLGSTFADEGTCPLQQCAQPVVNASEKREVDNRPDDPSRKAAHANAVEVDYGPEPSDSCGAP